jgi:hypothetical protein
MLLWTVSSVTANRRAPLPTCLETKSRDKPGPSEPLLFTSVADETCFSAGWPRSQHGALSWTQHSASSKIPCRLSLRWSSTSSKKNSTDEEGIKLSVSRTEMTKCACASQIL